MGTIYRIARRPFVDEWGELTFLGIMSASALAVAVLLVLVGIPIAWLDRTACQQRMDARPDVRMEWQFPAGCIALDPDQTVVVSQ